MAKLFTALLLAFPLTAFAQRGPPTTNCTIKDVEELRSLTSLLLCQDAGVQECNEVEVRNSGPARSSLTVGASIVAGTANGTFHLPGSLNDLHREQQLKAGVLPSALKNRDSALVKHLAKIRYVVGLTGVGVAVEGIARYLSLSEHCTTADGAAASGAHQIPDRKSGDGKCTLDTRHNNKYLHHFLYNVAEESQLRQIGHDSLLCATLKDLKAEFLQRALDRTKEIDQLRLTENPTCEGGDAVFKFVDNEGKPISATASAGADKRVRTLNIFNRESFEEEIHNFSLSERVNAQQRISSFSKYLSESHRNTCRTRACTGSFQGTSSRKNSPAFTPALWLASQAGNCCAKSSGQANCFREALAGKLPASGSAPVLTGDGANR